MAWLDQFTFAEGGGYLYAWKLFFIHPLLPFLMWQDEQMARERRGHQVEGGCCALVVVYLLGKIYVANAGDSRYAGRGKCFESGYRGSLSGMGAQKRVRCWVLQIKDQRGSGGITDIRKGLK